MVRGKGGLGGSAARFNLKHIRSQSHHRPACQTFSCAATEWSWEDPEYRWQDFCCNWLLPAPWQYAVFQPLQALKKIIAPNHGVKAAGFLEAGPDIAVATYPSVRRHAE
jgi:hypothetical protein